MLTNLYWGMYTFYEPASLVGVSELRTHLDEILKLVRKSKVFLGKRNKPVAVLVSIEKFQEMEDLLEKMEDAALGYVARDREKGTKLKEYISLDAAEKRVGLKK